MQQMAVVLMPLQLLAGEISGLPSKSHSSNKSTQRDSASTADSGALACGLLPDSMGASVAGKAPS